MTKQFVFKTGDIVLVSGHSKRAEIIQKFQEKSDKDSGKWNHSMLVTVINGIPYVYEAAEIEERKVKAAAKFTHISEYNGYELLVLRPKFAIIENDVIQWCVFYNGTPYDYSSLLRDQIVRTLTGWWLGKKGDKAARRMVCHELTQFIMNLYKPDLFPEWFKGDVAKIFHSVDYNKVQYIPNYKYIKQ
jgi:hypothetical protein